ncbi:MAG TPA: hydroxymethylglutaryl-CoA lyase, partial [Chitinophagaceae bacterium]|nr:hydroxymethylglutaryl-CoA lyase [Chitinophagaceae bacterium]
SPKAIPQMADTKEVLNGLNRGNSKTRLLAIIANTRGAEEACTYEQVDFLGFPFSVSPTFQLRNTNSTMEESLRTVERIQDLCAQRGKTLVVYLSMGFGNPYGDPWDEAILLQWADTLVRQGCTILSLADTVGMAAPEQISRALHALIPAYPQTTFGVHLHSAPHNWELKVAAAFEAGCRRFDGALRGIGGCPMATDKLVGNMATEWLMDYFRRQGTAPALDAEAWSESLQQADQIFINH